MAGLLFCSWSPAVCRAAETDAQTAPVYLASQETRQARLRAYLDSTEDYSEESKIQYLLEEIRHCRGKVVRNGREYDGPKAARWLDWKRHHPQYRKDPIVTARDFVTRVCNRSERTRKPYEFLREPETRYRLDEVMGYELSRLEKGIRSRNFPGLNVCEEESSCLEN